MTRALVVYESLLGNTQAVALAIAEGLARPGRSRCARWARHRTRSPDVALLVVGGRPMRSG